MYHIKQDARSQRSAKAIIEGLESCLEKKSISIITVSEVCAACAVGRATFYRLFDNLTDVLSYQCENIMGHISNKLNQGDYTVREACIYMVREWMRHVNLMKALVEGQHMDILYEATFKHKDLIQIHAGKYRTVTESDMAFLMDFLSATLPLGLMIWYRSGKKETAEELSQKMKMSHLFIGKLL